MTKMKLLVLDEEDTVLFNSQVNRTLYALYRDNADAFTLMWEQQGTGYWLKFCISLRSVLRKQGFSIHLSAFQLNYFETFCINLAKLLTGKSAAEVHTYVRDVVSVSRFHQLLSNIPGVFVSRDTNMRPAFVRLFGSPLIMGNVIKMCCTLPLHLRAVGCLLRLLERWLVAEAAETVDRSWWHVPETWHHGNQLKASHFEIFLKKNWDSQLLSLLGVHPRDICWWNDLPEEDRVTIGHQRHTKLGSFIADVCRKFDVLCPSSNGVMGDEISYHHVIASCPRGKFRILGTDPVTIMFVSALCRGLHLVDSMAAFHPFSQVIISFSNAAFSRRFWYGGQGMESYLHRWAEKHSSGHHAAATSSRDEVNFVLSDINSHVVCAHMAMTLNSKFYDTLYGDVTWTSSITLVRLPWNIPLFINWLEVLLIQIYKFDRFLIPLCHFPLRKNVISLVECVYRKVSEARFLVKTCLIVADGILKRKARDASVCYKPRKMLYDVIPRLSHVMKFLETDAYRILDVILRTGWDEKERETGESCPSTDKIKVDLAAWNSVPDIDEYYSENFRHINYWISSAEWPDIGGGEEFFTEACEMLKDYKPGQKTLVKMKDPYKFTLFMGCAQSRHLNLTNKSDDTAQDLFLFVTSVLRLLQEDGWLSPLAQKGFFAMFGVPHDLGHIQTPSSGSNGSGEKLFEQVVKFAAVYYVASCLVGDTWQCEIAGQNAFAQLQRNETLAIMADTGARLNILTHMSLGIVQCPPAQYFKDAAAEVLKHSKHSCLSIEEAMLLLESFEKEAIKKIDVSTAEALTPVKVPLLEEMQIPLVGSNWLKYLEKKRMQLLQLVSDEQFIVTRSYVKNNLATPVELFPLYDVLESRLVEEMASMQKCLEMGGLYYGSAYGVCRLLAHRFTWIQESFIRWKKGKHKFEVPMLPADSTDLHFAAVRTRIHMLAALIPLQALFFTYISKYRTTHPISEMTIDMFSEWTDIARLRSASDMGNILGDCLTDYIQALKQMGWKYFEQMLDHCYEVWAVTPFNSNHDATVEFGSIAHAQQIVATFTQLFLVSHFIVLVQNPGISAMDITDKLEGGLIVATMMLRQVELDESVIPQTWPRVRQALKKELRALWSLLIEMRKFVGTSARDAAVPRWLGNGSISKEFFVTYVGSHYRNILHKIAFSEFINTKDPEPDLASRTKVRNEPVTETNKSKANTKRTSPAQVPDKPGIALNGASNSKTESSPSSKSNVPDENVTGNKSQQKQRRQQQNNGASKQNAPSGNEALSKYKMCTYCKTVEPERRTYKKCSLCKKEGWQRPRFYCSKQCQENDWKAKHNMEHKSPEILQ